MWYAKWNNKKYKILDSISIKKSSREVTYSDLLLDFSECKMEDIPYAQQEVQILDRNENLRFTGFVSDIKLPELKDINTSIKKLTMSLFAPRQMATKRTVTIIRTDTISNIIQDVVEPLIQDGFYLEELNVDDKTISIKQISKTVEEVLNLLGAQYSIYWNINENKGIEVCSLDYLFNKTPQKSININNYKEEINGLIRITPSVESVDYGNIINIKNARVFYEEDELTDQLNTELDKNTTIDLKNPFDVGFESAKRVYLNSNAYDTVNLLRIETNKGNFNVTYTYSANRLSFQLNSLFKLQYDDFYKNLVKSIQYVGEDPIIITKMTTQSALRYSSVRFFNWEEIEKYKGIITKSGQIEKVVDAEEKWFTTREIADYVNSIFQNNATSTNQITIKYDKENNIEIGDRIDFNLPEYFTEGIFIVTAISESKEKNNPSNYSVELRNTNLLENYINLFRTDTKDSEDQTEYEYIIEYSSIDKILEVHGAELEDSNGLNSNLNIIL